MSLFENSQKTYFNSISGASSVVTKREATGDKSITLDSSEKKILHKLYSANLFTRAGGAAADGKPDAQKFNVYDWATKESLTQDLVIKYPKAKGQELRLYFKKGTGFYPDEGDEWFIFIREGEPHPYIGACPAEKLANLVSGEGKRESYEHDYELDVEDELYQKAIASPKAQKGAATYEVTSHNRDAALAANCLRKAEYKCQYDPSHVSFEAAASGNQYMEVHHLVPISNTAVFENSLDVEPNLVVLCPHCHRAIHYGTSDVKTSYLDKFLEDRSAGLNEAGISITREQLYAFYGIKK